MFRRRFFFAALMLATALATVGLRDLESGTFATFRDVENISGVAQAGVWTGKITIIKDSVPNSSQGFTFSDDLPNCDIGTRIDDGTATSTVVCDGVPAAAVTGTNYTISETPVAGWQLSNIVCSGDSGYTVGASGLFDPGDTAVTIDLDRGEDVVCTFTNTKLATLVIVKNTVGGNGGPFAFATTGDGLSSFNLTTPGATATTTFSNLVPGTARSVTESGPTAPWRFTSLSCTVTVNGGVGTSTWTINGQSVDNLMLAAGDTVTCTFTNTKDATLVVVKNTVGGNGTFNFSGTGAGITSSFSIVTSGGTASQTFSNLEPGGSRSVTESTVPSGWVFTSLSCQITTNGGAGPSTWDTITGQSVNNLVLAAGDTVTCTFTNTKLGQIVIIKDAVPNDGQDFSFTTSGGTISPTSFSLDDDADGTLSNTRTFNDVMPGTYTITESSPLPNGWSFGGIVCVDPSGGTTTSGQAATIGLAAGETVTCTFTNNKNGTIVIIKDAVPNDGQDFSFTASGGSPAISPSSFSLDDDGDNTSSPPAQLSNTQTFSVQPGTYTITESSPLPSGWTFGGISCVDPSGGTSTAGQAATIGLAAGETVSCTFTNTKQTGSITIVKDSMDANSVHHTSAQDFGYTTQVSGGAVALSPSTFTLDDDASGPNSATPNSQVYTGLGIGGTRSIRETPITGWAITNISCTGGSNVTFATNFGTASSTFQSGNDTVNIVLGANENVVCTFQNLQLPTGEACAAFTLPNPTVVRIPAGGAFYDAGNQDQILIGTDGADWIFAANAKDCILGFGGDDIIIGGNGKDGLSGGAGNDTIDAGSAPDSVDGGPGADACFNEASAINCEAGTTADLDIVVDNGIGESGQDLTATGGYTSKVRYTLTNQGTSPLPITWTGTIGGSATRSTASATISGSSTWACSGNINDAANTVTVNSWTCSGSLISGASVTIIITVTGTGASTNTVTYTTTTSQADCDPFTCTGGSVTNGNSDGSAYPSVVTDTLVP